MGYNFIIGNAVPHFDTSDFPYLDARFIVEVVEHEQAPVFPHDTLTGKTNMRCPSYSAWADFCQTTGIYKLFYTESGHLVAGHPGCIGITRQDVEDVSIALARYKKHASRPPGFAPPRPPGFEEDYKGNYDAHFARLIWLEYWMRWAVEHCELPAIQNT